VFGFGAESSVIPRSFRTRVGVQVGEKKEKKKAAEWLTN